MFGYVRPVKGDLKVWEMERYKAAYCGLCRAIKEDYGFPMTFTLNYDFAFLTLLLTGIRGEDTICSCRCAPGRFRRRPAVEKTEAVSTAAAASVILFKWKLKDEIADAGPIGRIGAGAAQILLHRGLKKAVKKLPDFDRAVGENIARLNKLENETAPGLDAPADTFAEILASLSGLFEDTATRRCVRELLYHTGRWIYIIDACQDLEKDLHNGEFNPLPGRFKLTQPRLSPDDMESVRETLGASSNAALCAARLLVLGKSAGIIDNILALGMPTAAELVLSGKWQNVSPGRHPKDISNL